MLSLLKNDIFSVCQWKQKEGPTDKKVHVNVKIEGKKVTITIMDEGEGFNHEKVPDPLADKNRMKTTGRGLFFMRSYCDSVEYSEGGRKITLVKEGK